MRSFPRHRRDSQLTSSGIVVGVGLLVGIFALLVAIEYPLAVAVVVLATVATVHVVRSALRGAVPIPGTGLRLRISVASPGESTYVECAVALDRSENGRRALA